nr:PREDICTED: uncharacterized protein LOC103986783 [Musa acuminata subsp. malaccensis]
MNNIFVNRAKERKGPTTSLSLEKCSSLNLIRTLQQYLICSCVWLMICIPFQYILCTFLYTKEHYVQATLKVLLKRQTLICSRRWSCLTTRFQLPPIRPTDEPWIFLRASKTFWKKHILKTMPTLASWCLQRGLGIHSINISFRTVFQ